MLAGLGGTGAYRAGISAGLGGTDAECDMANKTNWIQQY